MEDLKKFMIKNNNIGELIRNEAEEFAKKLSNDFLIVTRRGRPENEKKVNSTSQMRSFYDSLFSYYNKIVNSNDKESTFKTLLPSIYLVASRVAYANGKKNAGNIFTEFMVKNISSIETLEDFDSFLKFFEAILGYYKFLNPNIN
ncbi:type III-A CRISPR-associated protein Csm2 [Deferribacteraceae bacterium V6Fe1]|nr:type III-A CRISPR-associated protein Csm2 [Deferribacteraceae bacterium V6Fe1]